MQRLRFFKALCTPSASPPVRLNAYWAGAFARFNILPPHGRKHMSGDPGIGVPPG